MNNEKLGALNALATDGCNINEKYSALIIEAVEEIERLQRVLDQAMKISRAKIEDGWIRSQKTWCYTFELPELAQEIESRGLK